VCSGIEAATVHGNARDLRGHRNGRLTALEPVGRSRDGHVVWLCRCDCGDSAQVQANNLTRDAGARSCGCLRREAGAAKRRPWNTEKSYAIADGEHVYQSRRSWAKAALRAFGNACQRCGWNEARCDVHHRVARRDGGASVLRNAVVLCPNCHRITEEGACAM
jgi:hypothetical protein